MLTFEPDASHYQTCGMLASCCEGVGTVHLARHLPSGTLVAIKKFNMERAHDEASLIQHEVRLARQLRHPHVLAMHTAFVAGPHVLAVLPLMGFGSCRDLLAAHFSQGLPEAAIAYILHDTLLGLEYIHRKGIVHRAIRASHILISGSGRACLSGLRYSCHLVENGRWQRSLYSFPKSTVQNLNWLSPELLEQNLHGYNEKADVYSLGVTACELANGAVPFSDVPATLMLTEKVRGCAPQLLDCSTLIGPGQCGGDEDGEEDGREDEEEEEDDERERDEDRDGSGHSHARIDERMHDGHNADSGDSNAIGAGIEIEGNSINDATVFAQRKFSDAFHQMTELCLHRDPAFRPAASQLLQHAFFKSVRRGCSSNQPSLPELLHPVMPLRERHVTTHDDLASLLAADKLAELDIEPDQWDF